MAGIFHVFPSDPARDYFSTTSGLKTVEQHKKDLGKAWDMLVPEAQEAMINSWSGIEGDEQRKSGIDTLAETTRFLKRQSARTNATDAARKQLAREELSVTLREATAKQYAGKRPSSPKVDLIDAVKNAVGISYANLAGWLDVTTKDASGKKVRTENPETAEVRREIQKRADAEAKNGPKDETAADEAVEDTFQPA